METKCLNFFFGVGGWGNNFRMRGSLLAVARFVWLLRSFFNELQICLKVMVFFTCSQFYIFLIQCRRIQEQTGVGREPQQTNDLSQRLYRHLVVGFRSLFFYKVLRFFISQDFQRFFDSSKFLFFSFQTFFLLSLVGDIVSANDDVVEIVVVVDVVNFVFRARYQYRFVSNIFSFFSSSHRKSLKMDFDRTSRTKSCDKSNQGGNQKGIFNRVFD